MWKELKELIQSSVLTQWSITMIVLIIYFTLLLQGKVVPDLVNTLVAMVVSFYFGSKIGLYQGIKQEALKH